MLRRTDGANSLYLPPDGVEIGRIAKKSIARGREADPSRLNEASGRLLNYVADSEFRSAGDLKFGHDLSQPLKVCGERFVAGGRRSYLIEACDGDESGKYG